MSELEQQQQQQEQVSGESVQPQDGQGGQPEKETSEKTQQTMDWEKAYKNLEPEFTKKSQKLAQLQKWEEFEKRTGIKAEQALKQLEQLEKSGKIPSAPASVPDTNAQPFQASQYQQDSRLSYMEQKLKELEREREIAELKQRFPNQFESVYSDVIDLADREGVDLKTAFGRVVVDNWDNFAKQVQEETVQNIQRKQQKQVETSQTPEQGQDIELTAEEQATAKLLGISPKEYAELKNNTQLDDV